VQQRIIKKQNNPEMRHLLITTLLLGITFSLSFSQNNSLDFDGTDDEVLVTNYTNLNVTDSLTMAAWVYPRINSTQLMIVNKEGEYEMGIHNGFFAYAFLNSHGWSWRVTTTTIPLNSWTHVAVTYDGSMEMVYVNGNLVFSQTGTGSIGDAAPTENDFTIGYRAIPFSQRFNGMLDEVMVWDVARTQAQIIQDLNGTTPCSSSGILGYWKFDHGIACGNNVSISTTQDCTTPANDGLLQNFRLTGNRSNFKSGFVPLPVELLYFHAEIVQADAFLFWKTASETNNAGFEIQSSIDGDHWTSLGFIEGQGTTTLISDYTFKDPKPIEQLKYYRLKQNDVTGEFEYSKMVALEPLSSQVKITINSNCSDRHIEISLENPSSRPAHLLLVDAIGRVLKQDNINPWQKSWNKEYALDEPGLYFVSVATGSNVITKKLTITQ